MPLRATAYLGGSLLLKVVYQGHRWTSQDSKLLEACVLLLLVQRRGWDDLNSCDLTQGWWSCSSTNSITSTKHHVAGANLNSVQLPSCPIWNMQCHTLKWMPAACVYVLWSVKPSIGLPFQAWSCSNSTILFETISDLSWISVVETCRDCGSLPLLCSTRTHQLVDWRKGIRPKWNSPGMRSGEMWIVHPWWLVARQMGWFDAGSSW